MTEKVLTDEEKGALLDGVEQGAVEVHYSDGSRHAAVEPYEIGRRARIEKDSYPRLQALNDQLAAKLGKQTEQLLHCDVSLVPKGLSVRLFNEFGERLAGLSIVNIFSAAPLKGQAMIVMEPALVRSLVDAFFGGYANESTEEVGNPFTSGELSVSNLFANLIMAVIRETWASLIDLEPDRFSTETSIDLIDVVGETDPVIGTEFEVSFAGRSGVFRVLWPIDMVEPLLPVFDGQKKDRDPVEDARWGDAIRRSIVDSRVRLTSNVGSARMNLRSLVELKPGDTIDIESPQLATVFAKSVPIIRGRLGVHQGRNAVETVDWVHGKDDSQLGDEVGNV